MTAQDYGHLVMALLGVSLVAALPGWTPAGRVIWPPFSLAILLAALAIAGGAPEIALEAGATTAVAVGLAGCLAVVGGGPATALLLRVAQRQPMPTAAEERRGLWIGLLERVAVFVSLVAGFPEGIAIALAVKALGSLQLLRDPVAAERFTIGTFASVLWAAACAGAILLTR